MESITNKVAVITGGTRGIGFAIAERLLAEGVRCAICGTSQQTVAEAALRLGAKGDVLALVADVSRHENVKSFVASVVEKFGKIDILVNNAGSGVFRAVSNLEPEVWDRMISLNLSAAYYCSYEILPIFKQQGSGDVINISSLAGRNPFAGGAGYNASKFGLNGFSEAMMLDHREDGVRVSCIMPGSVATGFGGKPPETGKDWKIAPEDIAEAVLTVLRMPRRTTVSRIEIRPSRPPAKA